MRIGNRVCKSRSITLRFKARLTGSVTGCVSSSGSRVGDRVRDGCGLSERSGHRFGGTLDLKAWFTWSVAEFMNCGSARIRGRGCECKDWCSKEQ